MISYFLLTHLPVKMRLKNSKSSLIAPRIFLFLFSFFFFLFIFFPYSFFADRGWGRGGKGGGGGREIHLVRLLDWIHHRQSILIGYFFFFLFCNEKGEARAVLMVGPSVCLFEDNVLTNWTELTRRCVMNVGICLKSVFPSGNSLCLFRWNCATMMRNDELSNAALLSIMSVKCREEKNPRMFSWLVHDYQVWSLRSNYRNIPQGADSDAASVLLISFEFNFFCDWQSNSFEFDGKFQWYLHFEIFGC